ncbi:sensor histidine kinase [Mucilaginibacter sp. FT3.2]|uniref:sensor histidine kinase n=1 Tax=Mucilaginibacter sp. FT3.2 TaxID=2723090 RepID=UPI00160F30A8|nr:histidine kinase [Mucilaginibacter sp. FT3.2]MBB6232930.1 signal transduction histidine kinase [Mucilaginibacter sp. FT3.2]
MSKKLSVTTQTVGLHILFWLAFIAYQMISLGIMSNDSLSFTWDVQLITSLPTTIVVCYINLFVFLPKFYDRKKFATYTCLLLLLVLLAAFLDRAWAHFIWRRWDQLYFPERYLRDKKQFWISLRVIRNAAQVFSVIALTTFLRLARRSYATEKNLRELEIEKISAELGYLKAQINPHFFFNTLNSLHALTIDTSVKANTLVLRLSDLMHYMLYKTGFNKVPLTEEIKYLEDYISIEQLRFADRLEVSFQYFGDITGKMITPLLLLPFIENAFKHGITNGSGWVTINLKVTGNILTLRVNNSYYNRKQDQEPGLGIKNLKRRLELTYPSQHELMLTRHEEYFEAFFKIEL